MMKQVDPSPSSPAPVSKCWGAFFDPPVFVGTPLDRAALNQQNNGCRVFVKALEGVYKGRQVIVSHQGLVVLAEPQMSAAVELLNEIMVTLLIRSVPVNAVREKDLLECSIDTARKEIAGGEWWYEARRQTPMERDFEGLNARFYHPDNIRSYMRRAELMTSNPTLRADLKLLLEAFTLNQESAFTPSFLLSWSGVARLLQAQGQPQAAYQEAEGLREKHSDIVKSGREATAIESGACFHFLLSLLRKSLSSAE